MSPIKIKLASHSSWNLSLVPAVLLTDLHFTQINKNSVMIINFSPMQTAMLTSNHTTWDVDHKKLLSF